jgi:hypothetical protein
MNLDDPLTRRQVIDQGPVGDWRSVADASEALGHDRVSFHPDGTGELRLWSSVLGEAHECLPFHWRLAGPGLLSCRYVAQEYDSEDRDEAVDPADESWEQVVFTVEQRSDDVDGRWVLREVDRRGFWTLLDPVVPDSRGRPTGP